jgi:hypothetical protein
MLSIALMMLIVRGAIGQDIRYNFDQTLEFSKYKTYKWVALKGAEPVNDLTDKQIIATIDSELALKGLTRVHEGDADLLIGYQASVNQEKEFTSYSSDWGYGPGWYGGWYGGGSSMTTGQTSTIYIGQLVVDMYDSAQQNLVWRGVASKTLNPKAKPDKQQKNLNKAVAKLFKNYPPVVKKK